jgi:hypothetical protein
MMRKIEEKILCCIHECIGGRLMSRQLSIRDSVESTVTDVFYYLHGSELMRYDRVRRTLTVDPCGWDTQTTVSRVKMLYHIIYPYSVVRKKGDILYVYTDGQPDRTFSFSRNVFTGVCGV